MTFAHPTGDPVATPSEEPPRVWSLVGGLMLGMFVMGLDTLLIVTALPTIVGDLGGFDRSSWLLSSYIIAATASAPLWGRLGDLWGRKRLYQIALVSFAATSILCAVVQSVDQLIAARALRGLAAGGLMVLPLAIVAEVVPGRARARYLGVLNANVAAATLLGPLLGGFFVDHSSWRLAFLVGLPPAIGALVASRRIDIPSHPVVRENIDVAGAVLSMAATVAILLVVTLGGRQLDWLSPELIGLAVLGAFLLTALVIVERRVPNPMVPLAVFRLRGFSLLMLGVFTGGVAMFGPWSLMPIFLQLVTGASATVSGLLLLPLIVSISLSSYGSGLILSRTGRWKPVVVGGAALAATGFTLYTRLGGDSSRASVGLMMVVTGIGLGAVIQPTFVVAQGMVRHDQVGVGTSAVTFFRQLGQAFGAAIAITVFTSRVEPHLRQAFAPDAVTGLGAEVRRGTPAAVAALAEPTRSEVRDALAGALHDGFVVMVPIGIAAVIIFALIPAVPLGGAERAIPTGEAVRTVPARLPRHRVVPREKTA